MIFCTSTFGLLVKSVLFRLCRKREGSLMSYRKLSSGQALPL
jgi:hypothetical protein